METVLKLLERRGQVRWLVIAVFVISSACVLLPRQWIDWLQFGSHLKQYWPIIGIVFLCATGLVLVDLGCGLLSSVRSGIVSIRTERRRRDRINSLCGEEQAVIREFFIQQKNAISLPIDDPTVAGLLHDRVLDVVARNGQLTRAGMMFPCAISPGYKRLITRQHLGLPSGKASEEDVFWLMSNRPKFSQRSFLRVLF